jgi:DNA-binding transcriptional LysR family regulator
MLLMQRCLARALPGYITLHPKVSVYIEATDRTVNVIEERFDIAIRAIPVIEDVAGLVAKTRGSSQRVLVVSPAFLDHYGRPENPADLLKFNTVASTDDISERVKDINVPTLILAGDQDRRTRSISNKPRSFREFPEHGWRSCARAGTSHGSISLDNSPTRLELPKPLAVRQMGPIGCTPNKFFTL